MPRTPSTARLLQAFALLLVLALLPAGASAAGSRRPAGPEPAGLDVAVTRAFAGPLVGSRQTVDLWIAFKNNEKALFLQELEGVEVEITGYWDDMKRSETVVMRIDMNYRPSLHPGATAETATRLYVDRRHAGAPYRQVKARVLHYWGRWSL